jgi:hypothetical protein
VTLDPSGTPHIVINQMKDTVDQEIMVAALRKAFEILKTEAWSEILEAEEIPEREALLEIIKQRVSTCESCAITRSLNDDVSLIRSMASRRNMLDANKRCKRCR